MAKKSNANQSDAQKAPKLKPVDRALGGRWVSTMLSLESRLMFDGAALVDAADSAQNNAEQQLTEASLIVPGAEVVPSAVAQPATNEQSVEQGVDSETVENAESSQTADASTVNSVVDSDAVASVEQTMAGADELDPSATDGDMVDESTNNVTQSQNIDIEMDMSVAEVATDGDDVPADGVESTNVNDVTVNDATEQSTGSQASESLAETLPETLNEPVVSATPVTESIVFIDAAVADSDVLIEAILNGNEDAGEVVIIELQQGDGVTTISEVLANYEGLDSVHIISHGDSDGLILGGEEIAFDDTSYDDEFAAWQQSFNEQGDLYFYGCRIAENEFGQDFLSRIADLTGADVAASMDDTGAAQLGGDWDLEFVIGDIASARILSADNTSAFNALLVPAVADNYNTDEASAISIDAANGVLANDVDVAPTFNTGLISNDAALDTPGNSTFENETSNSNNWSFGTNVSPDTNITSIYQGITAAYDFPNGGTGATMASLDGIAGATSRDASFDVWLKLDDTNDRDVIFETGAHFYGTSIFIDDRDNDGVYDDLVYLVKSDPSPTAVDYQSVVVDLSDVLGSQAAVTDEFFNVTATLDINATGTTDILSVYINGNLEGSATHNNLMRWAGGNAAGLGQVNNNINAFTVPGFGGSIASYTNLEGSIARFNYHFDEALDASEVSDNFQAVLGVGNLQVIEVNGVAADVGTPLTLASGALLTLNTDGSFAYDPNGQFENLGAGQSTTDTFQYTHRDSSGGTSSATATITIEGINDAPVLDTSNDISLATVLQNDPDTQGTTVASLLGTGGGIVADIDDSSVSGVAITGVDNSNGQWQFSNDGGSTWSDISSVSDSSALVLDGSAEVRFVPGTDFSGDVDPGLTFKAWDQTDGNNSGDSGVDASTDGGSSAFSEEAETVRVDVAAMPISAEAGSIVINEVLYNETAGGTATNDEFIEIFNNSTSAIDLSGWQLFDNNLFIGGSDGSGSITGTNTPFTFATGTSLGAGEYAVIWVGENNGNNQAAGATLQFYLNEHSSLNNSSDDVWLYDDSGALVDYVAWGASSSVLAAGPGASQWNNGNQSALSGAGEGQSIALISNGANSNSASDWEFSTASTTRDSDDTVANGDERVTSVGEHNNGIFVEFTQAAGGDAEASGGNKPQLVISGGILVIDATVQVDLVPGTASSSSDFAYSSPQTITIAAGDYTTAQQIDLSSLLSINDDAVIEADETIGFSLSNPAGIDIGDANNDNLEQATHTYTIEDDDTGLVSVVANGDASEPSSGNRFIVNLDQVSDTDTIVTYSITGAATSAVDYVALTGTVTIAAGNTSALIDVTVIDDLILEDDENVIVTLTGVSGDADIALTNVVADQSASITISDDDSAVVSIANTSDASEPANAGSFTVSLDKASDSPTVVTYSIAGDAVAGTDYTALTGTVTIAAGDTSAVIDVSVLDDLVLEDDETVVVTLTGVSGDSDIALTSVVADQSATVTISDDDSAIVSIANTSDASEPSSNGSFTVSLDRVSDVDTVVTYSIAGDATAGADYTALTGTVTIAAGDTSAIIDVTIIDDLILEDDESVIVTLTGVSGDADITLTSVVADQSATVTISDDDTAIVSIANTTDASEPSNNGSFTVTLDKASDTDTEVTYSIAGDATAGSDYSALTGTVTITAGATSAVIDVNVIDDLVLEDDETVVVTLTGVSGDADIALTSVVADQSATVTISDDDSAIVSIANTSDASEPTSNGSFTVSLDKASDVDTVVTYSIAGDASAGSDYATLTGTVTIAAGDTSAVIDVSVIDDLVLEDDETVVITLTGVSGDTDTSLTSVVADQSATVTISDDDSAIVSIANTSDASEPTSNGSFTVSLDNASDVDTVVTYSIAGDASAGSDYTTLTGTVTIAAGDTSAIIDVSVIDDLVLEDDETVVITLTGVSGDADTSLTSVIADQSATVTISDDDSAIVSIANTSDASEPSSNGSFTVSLDRVSDVDTVVTYSIAGDATAGADYTALTGTVTIAAGDSNAIIDVTTIDDLILEDDETVVVMLTGVSGDADITLTSVVADQSATVTISDDDTAVVSIANTTDASEPSSNGSFTVTLDKASDTDTEVTYSIAGDATVGTDYGALTGTVTIAAGATSAVIDVNVIDDLVLEDDETVVVTLTGVSGDAGIALTSVVADQSATVTISDDDSAIVSIVNTSDASEPTSNGSFTVSLDNASDVDTVVTYSIAGDAIAGSDYATLTGTVTIAAGDTSAVIDVSVIDNLVLEDDETVVITLTGVSGDADISLTSVVADQSATVTISDDDSAIVSIANTSDASEPGSNGGFTVSLDRVSDVDTVVTYSIAGDATAGADYTALTGTVTITAGDSSAIIDVTTIDDLILEDDESVVVTLTGVSGDADITLTSVVADQSATVTISDDDTAIVSITNTTDASEPSSNGSFTVTLDKASDTDTEVTYSIAGDATVGTDYGALTGTVTITAGATSAVIDVNVIDDLVLEDDETVVVTLTGVSGDADIALTSIIADQSATVTISDDDSAIVSIANTSDASEPASNGSFTVSLDNASDVDTVVTYSIAGDASAGSDYATLTGTVTIAAGDTSAVIDVNIIDDLLLEDDETVVVTLTGVSGDADTNLTSVVADQSATVTISDDDSAIVSIANTSDVSEPASNGSFTVSLDNASDVDTVVTYSIAGDATAGSDYATLTGTVTIAAGDTSAIIDVSVIDDLVLEDDETVVVTLTGVSGDTDTTLTSVVANLSATVTISDDDSAVVSIANNSDASEPANNGSFTVSLDKVSDVDTVVTYSIAGDATAGVDYTALTGTVTIAAGDSSAVIDVTAIDDLILEDDEAVVVTLTGVTGDDNIALTSITADQSASVIISDDDSAVVSIALVNDLAEPATDGAFAINLDKASDSDTVVTYSVSGSATSGDDFVALTGTATIAAGQTTVNVPVILTDDLLLESSESIVITLNGVSGDDDISITPIVTAQSTTLQIADNDIAELSVAATTNPEEPATDGLYTITLSRPSSQNTIVSYTISGTATSGIDFATLSGTATILAGDTTVTVAVPVVDDVTIESDETITLTLTSFTGDPEITISSLPTEQQATLNIIDDDTGEVSIINTSNAAEAGANGVFTVNLDAVSDTDTVINYTVGGSATAGDDYTALSGTVTIAAGSTSATIIVPVINEDLVETTENVVVTLTGIASADADIALSAVAAEQTASLTINDDDEANVSIEKANDGAEPGTDGLFIVHINNPSAQDTIVSYTISGDADAADDFTPLSGSVTILAGELTANIVVDVLDDNIIENTERLVVTLDSVVSGDVDITISDSNVEQFAEVEIVDDDTALVSIVKSADASEPNTSGQFTVNLNFASATDTVVSYSLSGDAAAGSDYAILTGMVTIAAGDTSANIDIAVLDDMVLEDAETITITLDSITNGDADISIDATNNEATVEISDDDTAEVSIVKTADGSEPNSNGSFTVSLDKVSDTDTVVSYSVTGDAVGNSDYTTLSGTVTIAAGSLSTVIEVPVLDDNIVEDDESVIVTLNSVTDGDADITISSQSSATVLISDDDTAEVRIVKTTDASEPSSDGLFTVLLDKVSDTDTVVSYTIAGDAVAGSDYVALSGTVTILAGESSATITVPVSDDNTIEDTETVAVTLGSVTSGDTDISIASDNSATVDIADDDTGTVTIAQTSDGSEPSTAGQFTVSLDKPSDTDTVVSYSVSGDATANTDYTALSGSVTILAGQVSAVIDVTVLDDNELEDTESVTVTLNSITSGDGDISIDATNNEATVEISDDDTAEVSIVKTSDGSEPNSNGSFTVSLDKVSDTDTVVSYSVTGDAVGNSDYTTLSGTVTIAAGSLSTVIEVPVLDDNIVEDDESVIVTLNSVASGDADITISSQSSATVLIRDDDSAEVRIVKTTDASEPSSDGLFTVLIDKVSDTDTVVSYTIAGDAVAGSDYVALSGTVTILAGESSATITVPVSDDNTIEDTETVEVTLGNVTSGDTDISIASDNSATVDIADDDAGTVTIAQTSDGSEPSTAGQFTVSLDKPSDTDTVINYSVSGDATANTDYTTLSGSVTILAGQVSAVIDVTVLDDNELEDTESVTVTLNSITSGDGDISIDATNNEATVEISDDDTAEVSIVRTADGSEPNSNGSFTVSLDKVSDTDTVVSYSVTGDAVGNSDYTTLSGTVTIAAGSLSTVIEVAVLDDNIVEDDESVIVTLDSITSGDSDITISSQSSATVLISDDDSAEVRIVKTTDASEPSSDGLFTVLLGKVSDTDTVVSYTIAGDAVAGSDYVALSGTVTILAGESSATIAVPVSDDNTIEDTETVEVTLGSVTSGDTDISIASDNSATVDIADDDTGTVIIANTSDGSEPNTAGQFTVSLDKPSDTDTVVSYSVSGDATANTDYTALSGSVTILAGQVSAVIDVTVLDDNELEDTESVTVTLNSITNGDGDISIDATNNEATVEISDDDTAEVSIVKTSDGSEPNSNGSFTVSLDKVSDTDTVVSYSVSGDAVGNSDYTTLSGTVTIAAGSLSTVIEVPVLDDNIVEDDESVIVTLNSVTDGDADITISSQSSATVLISDDDTAEVRIVKTTDASEPSSDGLFTVLLDKVSDTDTVVSYTIAGDAVAGSDYVALSGTVTILAGESSATITVPVSDDNTIEDTETVAVTLGSVTSGDTDISIASDNSATVDIADDDTGTVTIAQSSDGSEPSTAGQFTVSLDKPSDTDTVVSYSISGDATANTDYTALSGSVTILAGEVSAVIDVTVLDDNELEDTESVTVTLNSITSGDGDISIDTTNNEATVEISDDDTAEVSIVKTIDGSEPNSNGSFTVSLDKVSDTDTVVSYSLTGDAVGNSDYTTLSGTVTIAAGSLSTVIEVPVLDDNIVEDDETVIVTLDSITSGDADITISSQSSATVLISDDDTAEVRIVKTTDASEPSSDGLFTVLLDKVSDTDTVVGYTIAGDAAAGSDYVALSGTVTILAGESSATITVPVSDDNTIEDTETVAVTLGSVTSGDTDISIASDNSATVDIADDDTGTVTIANTSDSSEPSTAGQFTVSLDKPSDTDTVINYSVSGDATAGLDYSALTGEVTILAGETSAIIDVNVLDDNLLEDAESVTVTLGALSSADADISISNITAENTATVIISDEDVAELSIVKTVDASEPNNNGSFTVSLDKVSDTDTVVGYTIGGDAVAGSDYNNLTGSVTIAAGESSALIDISVIDDVVLEDDENVTITLNSVLNGDADISIGSQSSASLVISDDDIAEITIAANNDAQEPANNGSFSVSLDKVSDTDTVIAYDVTGSAIAGVDYSTLSGTVTIAAGESSAELIIAPLNDQIVEATENVTVTLTAINSGDSDISLGAMNTATLDIIDDDSAVVSISKAADAAEPSSDGEFVVSLSKISDSDTVISYSIGGSADAGVDYSTLTGSVTILAGASSASITLPIIDDLILEPTETVVVTLDAVTSGDSDITITSVANDNTASLDIVDDDQAVASVVSVGDGEEGGSDATFLISLNLVSNTDTTIAYALSGDAVSGLDYTSLTGEATILAGENSVLVTIPVIDDMLIEDAESIVVTLSSVVAGNDSITITTQSMDNMAELAIVDNDATEVAIELVSNASEPALNGGFSVSIDIPSDTDTVIEYVIGGSAVAGVDYQSLLGSVVIPAGEITAAIDISVIDDQLIENAEDIILTLTAVAGDSDIALNSDDAKNTATLTLLDDEIAALSIQSLGDVVENQGPGIFQVSLTHLSATDTIISYSVSGNANMGSDFVPTTGLVTIPAGQLSAVIEIDLINDSIHENVENLSVTLDDILTPNVALDNSAADATLQILDDDVITASVTAVNASVAESVGTTQFIVTLSIASDTDTVIEYIATGSAIAGADYQGVTGSVIIPAGELSAIIELVIVDDSLLEDNEDIVIQLLDTNNSDRLELGNASSASTTILDNEVPPVAIVEQVAVVETAPQMPIEVAEETLNIQQNSGDTSGFSSLNSMADVRQVTSSDSTLDPLAELSSMIVGIAASGGDFSYSAEQIIALAVGVVDGQLDVGYNDPGAEVISEIVSLIEQWVASFDMDLVELSDQNYYLWADLAEQIGNQFNLDARYGLSASYHQLNDLGDKRGLDFTNQLALSALDNVNRR